MDYFPNTWSCSIEEQLDLEDIKAGSDKIVLHWGARALSEELSLGLESYNSDNFRVLSVILESDILNIALCAMVTLDISSAMLDKILRGVPPNRL